MLFTEVDDDVTPLSVPEKKTDECLPAHPISSSNQPTSVAAGSGNLTNALSTSQTSLRSQTADYDSSATLSADEGPHGDSGLQATNQDPDKDLKRFVLQNITLLTYSFSYEQ